jgi:hypothetical protein
MKKKKNVLYMRGLRGGKPIKSNIEISDELAVCIKNGYMANAFFVKTEEVTGNLKD